MKLKRTRTSSTYWVELTVEQMKAILSKDSTICYGGTDEMTLIDLLNTLPILRVNYDGHFGPGVEITLEREYNKETIWQQIEETILNYIK